MSAATPATAGSSGDALEVVAVGEALVDLVVRPDGALEAVPGGSPFNTARALARLGVRCGWAGGLSEDRFGETLRAALAADGVDTTLAQRTADPTTLALAETRAGGDATYRFYLTDTSAAALRELDLPAGLRALATGSLALALEPMATTIEQAIGRLPDATLLLLDPNARPQAIRDVDAWRRRVRRLLARTDIVKASREDLAALYPGLPPDAALDELVTAGPRVVVVTDGADPVRVQCGATSWLETVEPVDVVDTIGAGDTFAGALLGSLLHAGVDRRGACDPDVLAAAVRLAMRASAEVCRRRGADPPTLAELGGWP